MATILITAAKRVALKTLKRGLRTRGYEVVEASSGPAAIRYLAAGHRVDLVLSDYAMPTMNGSELLQAVRQQRRCLPVIIMIVYSDKAIVREVPQEHLCGFIDKPFEIDGLERVIRSHLKRSALNLDCGKDALTGGSMTANRRPAS